MYYFIKYIPHAFLAAFTTIILSLYIVRLQPPSPQLKMLEMLHLQYCQLPCWISIIPGKTTIGEARMLIESAYPPQDYEITSGHNADGGTDWLEVRNRQDDIYFSVNFNRWQTADKQTYDSLISQLTLVDDPRISLTLGDWFYIFGAPQVLSVTWGNHHADPNLLYDRQNLRLTLSNPFDNYAVDNPYISAGMLDIFDPLEWGKIYRPSDQIQWNGFSASNKDKLLASMVP